MNARLLALLVLGAMLVSLVPLPTFATTVTLNVICTMDHAATPQATVPLSQTGGGTPSPSTALCDGISHPITVNALATITATEPADGANQRDRFFAGGTTTTTTSCAAGTCTPAWTFTNYLENKFTAEFTPIVPATWDGTFTEPINGTQGGQSGTICSVVTSPGGGSATATCWSDHGRLETFPQYWATGGQWWKFWSPGYTFTDTTGGTTHEVFYARVLALTAQTQAQTIATTTTQSLTVTAQNNPGVGGVISAMIPFIIIFAFAGLFIGMASILDVGGDIIVTILLFGCLVGSALGTLFHLVPSAFTLLFAVLLILWLWSGGTAGEPLLRTMRRMGRKD